MIRLRGAVLSALMHTYNTLRHTACSDTHTHTSHSDTLHAQIHILYSDTHSMLRHRSCSDMHTLIHTHITCSLVLFMSCFLTQHLIPGSPASEF